jgi:hypothetical protein
MTYQERILPRPGYRYDPNRIRILPRPDYKPPTLHTRALPPDSAVKSVEVEWCPVCLGRKISERLVSGKLVWHCDTCRNEW